MARVLSPAERQAAIARAERRYNLVPAATLAAAGKPPTEERGRGARSTWYGELLGSETDPVTAWQLPQRWTTIAGMLGDPDVSASLAAITLPLRAVTMTVEPGSTDPLDVDIASGIERDLANMTVGLAQHRAEVLDCLPYGTAPFEIVCNRDRETGDWRLHKLAHRPPGTIERWLLDDHGGPAGIQQAARPPRAGEKADPIEPLTMDRLVVFVHDRRGGDLTGRSVLRAVYGPWMLKTDLAKTGAIAAYRNGVGLPTILYKGTDEQVASDYQSALMGLHAHSKAFLLLTELESMDDFAFKGVEGALVDPVPQMEYHRRAVYGATLTQFLLLGSGETGSFALSADHSAFLLLALQAIQEEIASAYNTHLIPKLVGYNHGAKIPADRMPKVTFGRFDRHDLEAWFTAVKLASEGGVPLTARSLEDAAHERLGLPKPERPEDLPAAPVADANNPAAQPTIEGETGPAPGQRPTGQPQLPPPAAPRRQFAGADTTPKGPAGAPRLESLVKLEALGIEPRFEVMTAAMDGGVDRLKKRLAPLQAAAAAFVARRAWTALRKGDAEALAALELAGDKEQAAFIAELRRLYKLGSREAIREIERQGIDVSDIDAEQEDEDDAILLALAAVFAARLVDRMKTGASVAAVEMLATGELDRDRLEERITAAPDSLLSSLALEAVAIAVAAGRWAAMMANEDKLRALLYTTAMDGRVCDPCKAFEGREYPIGASDIPSLPNPVCKGGARCRCALIPIIRSAP